MMYGKKKSDSGNMYSVLQEREEKEVVEHRQVFVAAIDPPFLQTCQGLVEVLCFLESFEDYSNMGGRIPLIQCVSRAVRTRMELVDDVVWKSTTEEAARDLMIAAYKPTSLAGLLVELRLLQYRGKGTDTIDLDAIISYAALYGKVLDICKALCISSEFIFTDFTSKLGNPDFSRYLEVSGLKNVEYKIWLNFVRARVTEFNDAKLLHMAIRVSQPVQISAPVRSVEYSSGMRRDNGPREEFVRGPERVEICQYNTCYGCGLVTTPPHKKADCPHKGIVGWGSREVLTKPLQISLVAADEECDVATVVGNVNGEEVTIGLDTMSSIDLISSAVVNRLGLRVESGPRQSLRAAGGEIQIEKYAVVNLYLGEKVILLKCGIIRLPIDLIASWPTIRNHDLLDLLKSKSIPVQVQSSCVVLSSGEGVKSNDMKFDAKSVMERQLEQATAEYVESYEVRRKAIAEEGFDSDWIDGVESCRFNPFLSIDRNPIESVLDHRYENKKKRKNKKKLLFKVRFRNGILMWLPYSEVVSVDELKDYVRNRSDLSWLID